MSDWKQRLIANKEKGAALVIVIILLTAMEVLGFALLTVSEIDYSVAGNLVRSEEALRASEQGIMIGIDWVINNESSLRGVANGTELSGTPCSATFRGRGTYTSCGSDEPPRWTTRIVKVGDVDFPRALPLGTKNYLYRIESTGEGARGMTRTIMVEVGIRGKSVWDVRSGESAAALGLESKLAATKYTN